MRYLSAVAMLLVLTLGTIAPARAQPRAQTVSDLNANAALKYWRGFANVPRLERDEQDKIVQAAATMPLTPRVREIVKQSETCLHELYNGAAMPACAWGMTWEDGIGALINEGPGARLLAGLACLRARLRFEDGNPREALDDVFAAMTLARHVSHGGSLIRVLVGVAVENRTIEVLAANLPRLDAAALQALPARWNKLPAGATMADGLLSEEKINLDWLEKRVQELKDRDKLVAFLDFCLSGEDERRRDRSGMGKAFLDECGGTAESIVKQVEEMRPYYATFAGKMKLPPDEIERAYEAEKKRMDKNPVFRLMAPALTKCRQAEAGLEVRRAMLQAAIAVQRDGKDALKAHPAPFDNVPFGYAAFNGGFELSSRFKFQDKPVTLVVGKR